MKLTHKWRMLISDLFLSVIFTYTFFDALDGHKNVVLWIASIAFIWHTMRMVSDFKKRTLEEKKALSEKSTIHKVEAPSVAQQRLNSRLLSPFSF
jgi:hypothetical protein